ncbi:MAG: hypothetical protein AABZ65_03220 [Candidatus Omnitrophota bacterium]
MKKRELFIPPTAAINGKAHHIPAQMIIGIIALRDLSCKPLNKTNKAKIIEITKALKEDMV